ncbi:hypothetical protein NQ317_000145 [Molorchus minor]|uniref:Uncharacterized protein n=1 Tax=Molorchus minor TaxID=1323400 RepID=A0ABQ9JET8_9CUCU|nr:hypothetical protein NQ317_000145 [Molorchus minor]
MTNLQFATKLVDRVLSSGYVGLNILENIVPIRKKRALGSFSTMFAGDFNTQMRVMTKNMANGTNGLIASTTGMFEIKDETYSNISNIMPVVKPFCRPKLPKFVTTNLKLHILLIYDG